MYTEALVLSLLQFTMLNHLLRWLMGKLKWTWSGGEWQLSKKQQGRPGAGWHSGGLWSSGAGHKWFHRTSISGEASLCFCDGAGQSKMWRGHVWALIKYEHSWARWIIPIILALGSGGLPQAWGQPGLQSKWDPISKGKKSQNNYTKPVVANFSPTPHSVATTVTSAFSLFMPLTFV